MLIGLERTAVVTCIMILYALPDVLFHSILAVDYHRDEGEQQGDRGFHEDKYNKEQGVRNKE